MALSVADIGYGATFEVGQDTSPETYTPVAEAVTIQPPGGSVDQIDITHLTSDNKFREKIATIKDATDAKITVNATTANGPLLYGLLGTKKNFKIKSNTSLDLMWTFVGFVKEVSATEFSNDDRLTFELTITVQGSAVPVTPIA